ncbi:MAG: tetratricopeptide repeat protein [Oligoflexia bacterium]|nr:tetratricopeptide repeat protein [Oligoflexia bacterium]
MPSRASRAGELDAGFVTQRELDAVSLARQAMAAFSKSQFVDAELLLRQSLYLYPKAPSVEANLATVLRAAGNFSESEQILDGLLRRYPNQAEYQELLARLRYEQSDYEQARILYSRLLVAAQQVNDAPKVARLARTLSGIAFRQGDEEAAICYSQDALNAKSDPEEFARHARLLLAHERPAAASAFLEAKMAEPGVPDTPDLLYLVSLSYFARGDLSKARAYEERLREFRLGDNANRTEILALRAILAPNDAGLSNSLEQTGELLAKQSLPPEHRVSLPYSFVEAVQTR